MAAWRQLDVDEREAADAGRIEVPVGDARAILLVPQRDKGIHTGGAAGGEPAG
jgi:hypothetical protein